MAENLSGGKLLKVTVRNRKTGKMNIEKTARVRTHNLLYGIQEKVYGKDERPIGRAKYPHDKIARAGQKLGNRAARARNKVLRMRKKK